MRKKEEYLEKVYRKGKSWHLKKGRKLEERMEAGKE
jgi:hypothetical protein